MIDATEALAQVLALIATEIGSEANLFTSKGVRRVAGLLKDNLPAQGYAIVSIDQAAEAADPRWSKINAAHGWAVPEQAAEAAGREAADRVASIASPVTSPSAAVAPLEALAALEHEQWEKWSREVAATGLTPERIERWQRYWVPYAELDEATKEHDRVWARKALAIAQAAEAASREASAGGLPNSSVGTSAAVAPLDVEVLAKVIAEHDFYKHDDMMLDARDIAAAYAAAKEGRE